MADEYIQVNDQSAGPAVAVDRVVDRNYQIVKIGFSADGVLPTQVSATDPLPVSGVSDGDYTQTLVESGAAAGLPATRTWTSGSLAGLTTTYTYDSLTGGLLSKVTA